jgi:hypothetical protein
MTMGMSIEPGLLAPQLNISSRISDVEFNLRAKSYARAILLLQAQFSMSSSAWFGVYSRFLHTITAPAVTAIISTSRTISGQLMLITLGRKAPAAVIHISYTGVVLLLAAAINYEGYHSLSATA